MPGYYIKLVGKAGLRLARPLWERACPRYRQHRLSVKLHGLHREQARSHNPPARIKLGGGLQRQKLPDQIGRTPRPALQRPAKVCRVAEVEVLGHGLVTQPLDLVQVQRHVFARLILLGLKVRAVFVQFALEGGLAH